VTRFPSAANSSHSPGRDQQDVILLPRYTAEARKNAAHKVYRW
jgi:hypothetical protein